MDRIVEFVLPIRCRYFIGWFLIGVAVYWSVYVFRIASWPFWIEVISPGATADPALSGPFAVVGTVVGAGVVFVITGLLRLRGAPRWLWIPIGATSVWYTALALWQMAPSFAGGGSGGLASTDAYAIAVAVLPLFSELATALAACLVFGRTAGSILGDPDERHWLVWTAALAVLTTALTQTGLLTGILGDQVIGWNLLVPGVVCFLGTGVMHLPRGTWLVAAETSLPMFLMWLTPVFLINAVSGADVSALVAWELLFVGLTSLSALSGALLGSRFYANMHQMEFAEVV